MRIGSTGALVRTLCLALVLVWAGVAATAQPAAAQTSQYIEQIVVTGNQRIEPETIASYMTVDVGDAFDPRQIDDSLKSLFATGLFADVSIRREGDSLIVQVVENPIITRIAFGFASPDALIALAMLSLGGHRPALPGRK